MYGEVYIDIVFAANLIVDYCLLRIAGMLMRQRNRPLRCVAAAAVGAFFSSIFLYVPAGNPGAGILLHCLCAVFMIRVAYGIRSGALLLKALLMLYLTAFLWGGFWDTFLHNRRLTVWLFVLTALGTYLFLGVLVLAGDAVRIYRKNIYPVTLFFRGRRLSAYGFYDTGNLLVDPLSGQPVSVVYTELLENLLGRELSEKLRNLKEKPGDLQSTEIISLKPHYLSLKTIGQEEKWMLAVTLEKLCIQTPGELVSVQNPVLALAFEPSALGREYKVLINSRLLH